MSHASRRDVLRSLSAGAVMAGLPALWNGCGEESGPRPNILFIMTDDHSAQAISAYGSRINATPHIDQLAEQGVRFDNCFATNAICAPSRASILTGQYSHMHGVIDNGAVFDGGQDTFPKRLNAAGYETALFGKWHLKSEPTGFDHYDILPGQGHYYNPDFIRNGEKRREEGYVTDVTTDLCLDWLNNRSSDKPFCVMLHHKAPHRNWMPAPRHLHLYEDDVIPLPETFDDDYATRSSAAADQDLSITHTMREGYDLKADAADDQDARWYQREYGRMSAGQKRSWDAAYGPRNRKARKITMSVAEKKEWKYQRYIKDYLRCIAAVDENVGRVLDHLDQNGLNKDTLVVYTSDQGFFLGEHGWFDKRFMYEESLRMPCIVRYPRGGAAGRTESHLAANVDFAPTFLDYAGVDIPPAMQGRSLKPLLQGRSPYDWRPAVYYHYFEYPGAHSVKRHYGLRTQRYKLIHFYYDIDAWELYDLQSDPHELKNLAQDKSHASLFKKLKRELKRLRRVHKDDGMKRFLPGKPRKVDHLALGAGVTYVNEASSKYPGSEDGALVNGILAPKNVGSQPDYKLWQGFEGQDLELTMDLGKVKRMKKITAGFLNHPGAWIFKPPRVTVSVSDDGRTWLPPVVWESNDIDLSAPARRVAVTLEVGTQSARYIRFRAHSLATCPKIIQVPANPVGSLPMKLW